MIHYDFHALLDANEFQMLACDIVGVRENIFLETYKAGKDQGIDGFYAYKGHSYVLQAKNHKPDFPALLRHLKQEVPKVQKLSPDRYI